MESLELLVAMYLPSHLTIIFLSILLITLYSSVALFTLAAIVYTLEESLIEVYGNPKVPFIHWTKESFMVARAFRKRVTAAMGLVTGLHFILWVYLAVRFALDMKK